MNPSADNTANHKSVHSISIGRSLFLRFVTVSVLSIILLTTGFYIYLLQPMVERNARHDFGLAAEEISHELDQLFRSVEVQLGIARERTLSTGFKAFTDEDFNWMFQPVLKHYPYMTSVVAGDTAGRGWMLLEQGGNRWHNRYTNVPRDGITHRVVEWDSTGRKTERLDKLDYDPRKRPWFTEAMDAPAGSKPHWTSPYIFFTTKDPGITGSIRIDLPDQRSVVIGFDIKLLDISKATMAMTVGNRGRTLVLTDDGKVIGLPHTGTRPSDEIIRKEVLKPVAAMNMPAATAAVAAWDAAGKKVMPYLRYEVGASDFLASFKPFTLGNQVFWVLAYAPEADFRPPLWQILVTLMVIMSLVLLLALIMAVHYTRQISAPLDSLTASSERIGRLDFAGNADTTIDTHLKELKQLAEAQERMRVMLNDFRGSAERQSDDLQQQISVMRQTEARLEHMSHHDPLTGLPNRTLFSDRLKQAIIRANRSKRRFALMFIDLDEFKNINDTRGHDAGDRVLIEAAQRMRACLREEDSVSRLGGDEFVALVEDLSTALGEAVAQAQSLADKLLTALAEAYVLDGMPHRVTASIGIALNTDPNDSGDALLHNADIAMYRAKSSGSNAIRIYDPSMRTDRGAIK